jgi:hypothetical protein
MKMTRCKKSHEIIHLRTCGEPAISLHSHHFSQVQWTTHLLPVMREPDSPVSIVSLHW